MHSCLKWPGGKGPLARRIAAEMPGHRNYVEPYFGSGAVLFAKSCDGIAEVANDINDRLMNFWRVLQSPLAFANFSRLVNLTPFSEKTMEEAATKLDVRGELDVEAAAAFFVRIRQSLAARGDDFASVSRTRLRRGMNEQVSAWLSAVEGLQAVHARLQRVLLMCRPALKVLRDMDDPGTLAYLDCPYMHATRTSTGEYGVHEMSDADHEELVAYVVKAKSKFVVSMYHHPVYDVLHLKHGWRLKEIKVPNNAAGGKSKRIMTECLWMNY